MSPGSASARSSAARWGRCGAVTAACRWTARRRSAWPSRRRPSSRRRARPSSAFAGGHPAQGRALEVGLLAHRPRGRGPDPPRRLRLPRADGGLRRDVHDERGLRRGPRRAAGPLHGGDGAEPPELLTSTHRHGAAGVVYDSTLERPPPSSRSRPRPPRRPGPLRLRPRCRAGPRLPARRRGAGRPGHGGTRPGHPGPAARRGLDRGAPAPVRTAAGLRQSLSPAASA